MSNPGDEEADLVRVFETTDVALLPIIKSILEAHEIPYFVQGDEALGVLPLGSLGLGSKKHGVRAIVHVSQERADDAKRVLAELDS